MSRISELRSAVYTQISNVGVGLSALPTVPSIIREAPTNEVGVNYRIAFWYAVGARLTKGFGGLSAAATLTAAASAMWASAESLAAARYTPAGQLFDVGKVESPEDLGRRFVEAAGVVQRTASGAGTAQTMLVVGELMKSADVGKIKAAQEAAGEYPGAQPLSAAQAQVRAVADKAWSALPDLPDAGGLMTLLGNSKPLKYAVLGMYGAVAVTAVGGAVYVGRKGLRRNPSEQALRSYARSSVGVGLNIAKVSVTGLAAVGGLLLLGAPEPAFTKVLGVGALAMAATIPWVPTQSVVNLIAESAPKKNPRGTPKTQRRAAAKAYLRKNNICNPRRNPRRRR